MSNIDFRSSCTVEPAGRSAIPGIAMSRLCPPPLVAQPKSLPEPENHACVLLALSPVSNLAGSSSWRPGSLAVYICELCTVPSGPSVSVYGVPSGVCQWMVPVSCLESVQLDTVVVRPACSTCGTTQPSSWREKASMFCDLSVAIRFQSP